MRSFGAYLYHTNYLGPTAGREPCDRCVTGVWEEEEEEEE